MFSSWCTTVLDGFVQESCADIVRGQAVGRSIREEIATQQAEAADVDADFDAYMKQNSNG